FHIPYCVCGSVHPRSPRYSVRSRWGGFFGSPLRLIINTKYLVPRRCRQRPRHLQLHHNHHHGRRPHLRVQRQHELRRLLRSHRPRPQEARRRRELRGLPREPKGQGRHQAALRDGPREDRQDGQDDQLGHGRRRREVGRGACRVLMCSNRQAVLGRRVLLATRGPTMEGVHYFVFERTTYFVQAMKYIYVRRLAALSPSNVSMTLLVFVTTRECCAMNPSSSRGSGGSLEAFR
ncbi:hypothetical protein TCAP_02730, partial [Tolypocladium capitatum]